MSERGTGARTCRSCQAKPLRRLASLEREGEPPGDAGHVVVYRHTIVLDCPSCGAAEVERLDHDCWDHEEVWDQYEWYLLDPESAGALRAFVAACPRARDAGCGCRVHDALRKACASLPAKGWSTALEHGAHVHRVRFEADTSGQRAELTVTT